MSLSREVPDWIEGFMQFTDNTEAPGSYRFWTAVSCVAACLQRKCFVRFGHITFYPNMYILLCGPSGVRKGTAMTPGLDLLRDVDIKLASNATSRQALIRRLKEANYTSIDPKGDPVLHSSLTTFSKEFTVFLGYKNNELMSDLCDWYDCDPDWTYETISRDKERITGVWFNLIGATTPTLIHSSMPVDAIGGGLTSRMIIVYETHRGKTVHFHMLSKEELELRQRLKNDLERINLMVGPYKYSEEFISMYIDWRENTERNPPQFHDPRFDGYMSRRPTHIIKLSMIMSASSRSDLILHGSDLKRAVKALESVEVNMPAVFSGVGKSDIVELVPRVLAWLRLRKEATMAELMRDFYYDADVRTMERVLQSLERQEVVKTVIGKGKVSIIVNQDAFKT